MMKMKVAWVPLIFMIFYHVSGAGGDIHSMLRQIDEEENDPSISQADKDKLDEFRTTMIKQEILKMLGLESAPNVSNSPQVPKQMVDSVLRQTDRKRVNEAGASREVIVMAEQGMIVICLHLIFIFASFIGFCINAIIKLSLSWINILGQFLSV